MLSELTIFSILTLTSLNLHGGDSVQNRFVSNANLLNAHIIGGSNASNIIDCSAKST